MLLYELAIALDRRSTELADAAAGLGLGDLQPGSELDAQQVAALRSHFSGGVAPAPPSALGPPPPTPPAPTSDPSPGAPLAFGPPPEPPGHVGPAFAYPDSPIAQGADGPGRPAAAAFAPPPPDPGPTSSEVAPASSGSGFGTGQKVLIGAVVAGVLALFAFMAVNTGPDERREQALAAKDAELDADRSATTLRTTTTTAPPAATTAPPPTPSAYDVVDVDRFCAGGLGIATLELRLAAALGDQDFAELSSIVRDRRNAWNDDVASVLAGAPPILVDDVERYRDGYVAFFDAVAGSSSLDQAYAKVDRMQLLKAGNAGQEVSTQIANECE